MGIAPCDQRNRLRFLLESRLGAAAARPEHAQVRLSSRITVVMFRRRIASNCFPPRGSSRRASTSRFSSFEPSSASVDLPRRYAPPHGVRDVEGVPLERMALSLLLRHKRDWLIRQTHTGCRLSSRASRAARDARLLQTARSGRRATLNFAVGTTMAGALDSRGLPRLSLVDDLLSGMGSRIGYSLRSLASRSPALASPAAVGGGVPRRGGVLVALFIAHVLILPGGDRRTASRCISRSSCAKAHAVSGGEFRPRHKRPRLQAVAVLRVVSALSRCYSRPGASSFCSAGLVPINPIWQWGNPVPA